MLFLSIGSAAAQDITAGYVNVATLPVLTSGAGRFLLEIRFTGLNAGHQLRLRETYGATILFGTIYSNGQVGAVLELERAINVGTTAGVIAVTDAAALSAAVSWVWTIYRLDEEVLPQPSYLVPKDATTVPLIFRVGKTSPVSAPAVALLKNGAGGFVAAGGTLSAIGSGWYALMPAAGDTSTEGPLILRAIAGITVQYACFQIFSDSAAAEIASAVDDALADDVNQILNAIGGADAGTGSQPYTILVEDDGGDPIDNAEVWITTDAAGEHVTDGPIFSAANGEATFLLDPGDYYAWAEHGGKVRIAGQAFTVS